jgi:hypothetical protein
MLFARLDCCDIYTPRAWLWSNWTKVGEDLETSPVRDSKEVDRASLPQHVLEGPIV